MSHSRLEITSNAKPSAYLGDDAPGGEARDIGLKAGRIAITTALKTDNKTMESVPDLQAQVELYRAILDRVTEVASQAAQGNLEVRMLHCESSPRLRTVGHAINQLLDMTDAFLREAGASLEHSSRGKFFRRVLLRGMRGTFRHKSQLINEATERMSQNAASLHEVEDLVRSSAEIAQGAVREAAEAQDVIKHLGETSAKIGEAVKSISQIAWQTKLLAFNARIEASYAGDAGRGFEVVAGEVKNLAQETAASTEGIAREVAAIRDEVARTTHAIDTVSKTIEQMQEISAQIEAAVAERLSGKNRSPSFK